MDVISRLKLLRDDIINLGFSEEIIKEEVFINSFHDGQPSILFIDIVTWLSTQLRYLCKLESNITPFEGSENFEMKFLAFMVELSSLLQELNCPIKKITCGLLEDRLSMSQDQENTIRFLCSELQAAKINYPKTFQETIRKEMELEESKTAKELKKMLIFLNFGKPPDNITPQQLFGEVNKKIKQLSHPSTPKQMVEELIFTGCLTEKQWFQINDLFIEMYKEYRIRRSLLITRLDVTVKSFSWSDRLKVKLETIELLYNKKKNMLVEDPNVKISDILSASLDLTVIEKTSSANVIKNTKSSVNKVIIGPVPDRGGRPEEQQPPPPEIPSWQKNDQNTVRGGFQTTGKTGDRGHRGAARQLDRPRQNESSTKTSWQRQGQENNQRNETLQSRYREIERAPPINTSSTKPSHGQCFDTSYMKTSEEYNSPFNPSLQNSFQNPYPGNFGFGGYLPAGDNYAQFVTYQSFGGGDDHRQRGRGYSNNRGGRSYRGNSRGRY